MAWLKRVMERGQPPVAAPYATTPRGYPFPLRSWPPDTAIDIQNLAEALDADIAPTGRPAVQINPGPGIGSQPSGTNTLKGGTATVQAGWLYNSGTGVHTCPTAGFYTLSAWVGAVSATSSWQLQFNVGGGILQGPTVLSSGFNIVSSLSTTVFVAAGASVTFLLVAHSAALTVGSSYLQAVGV